MDTNSLISKLSASVNASGIRRVFDLSANLKNPINLSVGQPDFDVPDSIKAACVQAIHDGQNRYTQAQGTAEARQGIVDLLARQVGWKDPAVIMTCGVTGGLTLALMAMIDPGDEVILLDPYFVAYKQLTRLFGGVPVIVPTYPDFRIDAGRVAKAITRRTKLILLNTPCNPTGYVATAQELKDIVELADRRGVMLLSDEIYSGYCYDAPFVSAAQFGSPEQMIVMNGFSKTYSMTGWRSAWAAGPRDIIEEMTKLQQYTFVNTPTMVQRAGLTALATDMSSYVETYRHKRDLIYQGLCKDFEVAKPGGAFYIFPKAPADAANATEFVEAAIANNVLIVPGSVLSEQDTHFRISFAATDQTLVAGAEVLCRLARAMR